MALLSVGDERGRVSGEKKDKKNYFITAEMCISNVLNKVGCVHIFMKYLFSLCLSVYLVWDF